jgi:chromosome segregation ATPase
MVKHDDDLVDLSDNLKATSNLIERLLTEIQGNGNALAILKEKVTVLEDVTEKLNHVLRDDNGSKSMITRLALLEAALEDMYEEFYDLSKELASSIKETHRLIEKITTADKRNETEKVKLKRERFIAKVKLWAVAIPGVVAIIIQILQMLQMLK